jgi:sugar phosphate isomerase/epimerase
MKIGYGTYGMPEVPVMEALPRLAALGYEAVEICVADRWPTAPRKVPSAERAAIREMLQECRLEASAFMLFLTLMAPTGTGLAEQERLFREACEFARSVAPGTRPVIITVLGHCAGAWDAVRDAVAERTLHFASLAEAEGCRLALEPHVNALLDRPDRVTWLMERTHGPCCGINFDISHFAVAGYPRAECIASLAPYAFHTHVKDGTLERPPGEDPRVRFLLPGEGDFDYVSYFREMAAAGYAGPITVEVTAQIFNLPAYDPWTAAAQCLRTLREAKAAALPG